MEIGDVDDDRIEVAGFVRERFAIIFCSPGVGMLFLDLVQLALVHIAEAGPLDHRMAFESVALHAADAAHADLKDAQLAILINLRAGGQRESRHSSGDDGA